MPPTHKGHTLLYTSPPPPPPKKKIQILYEPLKMYNVKIITDMQREALEISLLAEVL